MADYYTRTVLTGPVPLTDAMLTVVSARGADTTLEIEEGILDAITQERLPLKTYHVSFEDGWRSQYSDNPDEEIEELGIDDEDVTEEIKRLVMLDEADFFHESLLLDPSIESIEIQSSWGCSKMRLDGFGGSGLILTKKGYLCIITTDFTISDDGVIALRSVFSPWEELDEQAESPVESKEEVLSE